MNYITAMLLLSLNKCEEDAFWVLVALIDDGECIGRPGETHVRHVSSALLTASSTSQSHTMSVQ